MIPAPRFAVPFLLAAILLATLLVHLRSLIHPLLLHDDFDLILKAWTWDETHRTMWVPMNEHAWPLTRLWTWAVVTTAGSAAGVPLIAILANRVLLLAAVALVYLFVKRERGHAAPGLAAAAVFGISSSYLEAVYWFAASPAVGALAFGLLGLIAVQRWRQSGSVLALGLSAVWSALAPGWFAGGVLAGPFCALYLIGRGRGRWWAWVVPLLGTAGFLAISLTLTGERILHTDHYGGKTAVEAFSPLTGLWHTLRSLVDCLALGTFGVPAVATPVWVVLPALIALGFGLVWWWKRAADGRLIVLGLGFVLVSYWLIHAARAGWEYDQLVNWSRYGVYPQCGLALILGAGWPGESVAALTRLQARTVAVLTAVLLVLQFPRGYLGSPYPMPQQVEVLRLIDTVDQRCIESGVSAADAVEALPAEDIPASQYNRWRYLRGSSAPRPLTPVERAALSQTLLP